MAPQPAQEVWQPGGWIPVCKICERDALVDKKIFRMSGPVVGIGFLLLISSVLGIIVSALMLFGVLPSGASDITHFRDMAVAQMRVVDVPESVVAVAIKVTSRAIVLLGSGFAVALGVTSFVCGLLGWLLVLKRRVLQCSECRAAIDAS